MRFDVAQQSKFAFRSFPSFFHDGVVYLDVQGAQLASDDDLILFFVHLVFPEQVGSTASTGFPEGVCFSGTAPGAFHVV